MSEPVYVFGAGGLASEFTLMLEDLLDDGGAVRFEVVAYVETEPHGTSFMGKPIISEQRLREVAIGEVSIGLFMPIGSAEARARIVGSLAGVPITYPTFVHPSVKVNATVELGAGVIICQNVLLTANVRVGSYSYVNFDSSLAHDVEIGEFTFVGPKCCINGNVTIGQRCMLGAASAFHPGVTVGDESVVGMGAIVLRDVGAGTMVVGNPARQVLNAD